MTSTTCDCCGVETHHIEIAHDSISYNPGDGWVLHLTTEEIQELRAELGAYL